MPMLLKLFLPFAKVGVMTFGGGYAMLPILQREVVETQGWATEEELADYFAIGQCTPGVIAVNTATFVGQKQRGIVGGIVTTLGKITPRVAMTPPGVPFSLEPTKVAVLTAMTPGVHWPMAK